MAVWMPETAGPERGLPPAAGYVSETAGAIPEMIRKVPEAARKVAGQAVEHRRALLYAAAGVAALLLARKFAPAVIREVRTAFLM